MKSLVSLICLILAFSVMAVHGREAKGRQDEWESGEEAREDTMLENEMIPGTCLACKSLLNKIKKILNGSDDTKYIKEKLLKICGHIKVGKTICRKVISKYSDVLVKMFSKHDDVRTMCVKIKLCKPKPNWEISN